MTDYKGEEGSEIIGYLGNAEFEAVSVDDFETGEYTLMIDDEEVDEAYFDSVKMTMSNGTESSIDYYQGSIEFSQEDKDPSFLEEETLMVNMHD